MISLFFAGLLGYLLGSFPAAYVFVLWKSKIDIRAAGSGNVGTLNSFEVTGSRLVGLAVLIIDLAKGFLTVVVAQAAFGAEFAVAAISGVAAVLGHNFPVWLRFKGGRGLATGAGVMFAIAWQMVVVWLICWGCGFAMSRGVNIANTVACLLTLLIILALPLTNAQGVMPTTLPSGEFSIFALVFLGVILVKHFQPVREFILEKRTKPAER